MSQNSNNAPPGGIYWFVAFFGIFVFLIGLVCVVGLLGSRAVYPHMRRYWGCCCWVDWESFHAARQARVWAMRMARDPQLNRFYEGDDSLHHIKEGLTEDQRLQVLERILTWRVFSNPKMVDAVESLQVESPQSENGVSDQLHGVQSPQDIESGDIVLASIQDNPASTSETGTMQQISSIARQEPPLYDPTPASEVPTILVRDPEQSNNECAICLEALIDGQIVNDNHEHVFHRECLLGWLDHHLACPYCRKSLVTNRDWKRGMEELGIVPQRAQDSS